MKKHKNNSDTHSASRNPVFKRAVAVLCSLALLTLAVYGTGVITGLRNPDRTDIGSYEQILEIAGKYNSGSARNSKDMLTGREYSNSAPQNDSAAESTEKSAAAGYGKTNTQNEMDEADILKTDGKYLYILPQNGWSDNTGLKIVDIQNPALPSVCASIQYQSNIAYDALPAGKTADQKELYAYNDDTFYPREMYVDGGLLLVIGDRSLKEENRYKQLTEVVIYDVNGLDKKEKPKEIRTFSQDGYYNTSRYSNGCLYLISNHMPYYDDQESSLDELVPSVRDSSVNGGKPVLVAEKAITVMPLQQSLSYVVASAVNCKTGTGKTETVAVLGNGGAVYATKSSLYVACAEYPASPANGLRTEKALADDTPALVGKDSLPPERGGAGQTAPAVEPAAPIVDYGETGTPSYNEREQEKIKQSSAFVENEKTDIAEPYEGSSWSGSSGSSDGREVPPDAAWAKDQDKPVSSGNSSSDKIAAPDIDVGSPVYSIKTNIIKFTLNGTEIKTAGNIKIDGTLLNQFSMDEYNGNFRLAATVTKQTAPEKGDSEQAVSFETSNGVYVFDKTLKPLGKVDGLAKTEQIYSVRFMGDMVYVVTFKQVDPLFAIDLSDPSKPKVLGELKIPGFSNYLHPISDKYLLGLGSGGDENGSVSGFKVSVFDLSTPSDPVEKANRIYENTTSEVNYNHKAALFIKDRDLVCIPVFSYETRESGTKLLVLKTDEKGGFQQVAELNSGTQQSLRATYSGNVLYTVTNKEVTSYSLDSFKKLSACSLAKE